MSTAAADLLQAELQSLFPSLLRSRARTRHRLLSRQTIPFRKRPATTRQTAPVAPDLISAEVAAFVHCPAAFFGLLPLALVTRLTANTARVCLAFLQPRLVLI